MIKKIVFLFILFSFQALHAQMTPTYEINIPMRDGKFLAADVYVPTGATTYQTILIQTPYNKNAFRNGLPLGVLQNINANPYAWVVVDWRGFYGSSSAAISQPNRGEDGYDVIEWIIAQTWSGGRVGTWGPSALGGVQYNTAKEYHPNHTCAVPLVAQPQTAYDGYFYGGVLEKSRLAQLDALGYGLSPIILANPYYSLTWEYTENTTWYPQNIHIPMLQIGGWYDHNIDDMVDWFQASRTMADINVRDEQWFLIGPWVHGGTGAAYVGSPNQGELTYTNAAYESDLMAIEFFEHYLLDSLNNWESTPAITYYELGKNTWGTSSANSIEITSTEELFLKENNGLDIQVGTGFSSFVSDPHNPSPTLGGPTLSTGLDQGPYDQISLEGRTDIETFTTADLGNDVSISGRVKLDLFVTCDQPDADIAVRLVDVYPDGRNMLINDGIRRMRFRNGYYQTNEVFMLPGQVYEVEIELPFVNYTWKAGHQIKVYISGNNSTRWDVNLQNGGTMYAAGDTNVATIEIQHNIQYPSKIVLPCDNLVIGMNENEMMNQVFLFPNPSENTLNIKSEDLFESYIIIDMQGNLIQNDGVCNQQVNISDLPKGMFILKLIGEKSVVVRKFSK